MDSSLLLRNPSGWIITGVDSIKNLGIWFDDGEPVVGFPRGGSYSSSRLMVESQGFLDITVVGGPIAVLCIDFNDKRCIAVRPPAKNGFLAGGTPAASINLTFPGDGSFSAFVRMEDGSHVIRSHVSGVFKRFPEVLADDAAFLQDMISRKYVPYQHIPDEPGKTDEEIKALGKRLFPWSPHSYELAMTIYDWTTASFTRMVLLEVFRYTSVAQKPLDCSSVASMIFASNWGTYTPSNSDYMNSFMMQPASSKEDVERQLVHVSSDLQRFSDVENRLLVAAVQSLPRTCILAKPYLFSGQVDIYQMGMGRFGVEMLEFPGNEGPVGQALEVDFAAAAATFIQAKSVITTKMTWSFTDSEKDALHYSNGILLVVEPPPDSDSLVWAGTAYITPLSDGPTKTEYVFPGGTRFLVLSVDYSTEDKVQVIRLQVLRTTEPSLDVAVASLSEREREQVTFAFLQEQPGTSSFGSLAALSDADGAVNDVALAQSIKTMLPDLDMISKGEEPNIDHVEAHKTNGRRCRCVDRHV